MYHLGQACAKDEIGLMALAIFRCGFEERQPKLCASLSLGALFYGFLFFKPEISASPKDFSMCFRKN